MHIFISFIIESKNERRKRHTSNIHPTSIATVHTNEISLQFIRLKMLKIRVCERIFFC